jgi:adenosylcobinamide-GDP ribazoletransferase
MTTPDATQIAAARSSGTRIFTLIARSLRGVRLAAGFLTILPIVTTEPAAADDVAASMRWFPLVGFALGLLMAIENSVLILWLPVSIAAVLTVMSIAILSGGVHLDGLADSADALGAGADRERALRIMRDSRIGGFGAMALFFILSLKVIAIATAGPRAMAALFIAPGIARWAIISVAYRTEYLRENGAGSVLLAARDSAGLIVASLTAIAGTTIVLSAHALLAAAGAVAASWLLRRFYLRWLGGVTGDMLGAAGELIETIVLVMMSMRF